MFFAQPQPRPCPPPLHIGGRTLAFGGRFYLMGVLNVTPDSFSDGGQFFSTDVAIAHGLEMARAGADLIDVGGESARPGAQSVSREEEAARVVPVIAALSEAFADLPSDRRPLLSVDTSKASVADAALQSGAHIVNDISALGFDPDMARVVAHHGAALVLMHIRGTPRTMQLNTDYADLIADIHAYFTQRLAVAHAAGIPADRILVDPGIGFGKDVTQNVTLIRELHRFFDLGCPILLGTSRKSFLGKILDKPSDQRLFGDAAALACGLMAGADIVRVHDVAQMRDVLRVTQAIAGARPRPAPPDS